MPSNRWNYRIRVTPGHLEHLPAVVGPDTGWLNANSLQDAKRACNVTAHALAQCLGETTDPGKVWTKDRARGTHHLTVTVSNFSGRIIAEIRPAKLRTAP